jgi:hypothetical protein
MRYRDICDQEPEPEHPAKRERPRDIAALYVHEAEWDDLRRICQDHGSTAIIGVRKVPIIPAFDVDVRCEDAETAMALSIAWGEFCEISPHRPRTAKEREEWGLKVLPEFANIPRDWTF